MPLHWQPVGPHPAATYWRRRAGVALVALLVLVLAWPVLSGGDDETLSSARPAADPTAEPSADPTADPSAAPDPSADPSADPGADPSADPSAAEPCPDTALEVTAAADAGSYPVGATARLELSVRNTGTVPCRTALGQGAVELLVTSGDDRIWSSDDCAAGGPQDEVVLAPGAVETARASWPTVRSAPGCPADQSQALPGTYRLTARVGQLQSAGDSFTVG